MNVKINKGKLKNVLAMELINISDLADLANTSQTWISNLSSLNTRYKASPVFARKLLDALNSMKGIKKGSTAGYKFDDVFYYVN